MAGFIPAIHVFTLLSRELKTWMPAHTSAEHAVHWTAMGGHDGERHCVSCGNGSDFPRKRTLTAP